MVHQVRRAGVVQSGGGKPFRHLGEMHRLPVAVEVLVREVVRFLSFYAGEPRGDLRVRPGVGWVRRQQPLGELHRCGNARHDAAAEGGRRLRMLHHQMT